MQGLKEEKVGHRGRGGGGRGITVCKGSGLRCRGWEFGLSLWGALARPARGCLGHKARLTQNCML